jgi:predicted nucleic acid-binding protein
VGRIPGVVLDTMMLAQALTNPDGPAGGLLRSASRGVFKPVTSWHQLMEFDRTMRRPWAEERGVTDAHIRRFSEVYSSVARVALDRPTHAPLTADPGDNYLVRLAQTTGSVVVTRDEGILRNHPEHVPVMTPGEFADTMAVWEVDGATYRLATDASGALVIGL